MEIPENVMDAIKKMFLCKNLKEHLECYNYFYEDLKDCTFVAFSEDEGTKLPEALCTNYDNGFAIINIGYANRFYAVDREIYAEMMRTGKSDYTIDTCIELDTQAVSYLKDIFVEYNQVVDCDKIKGLIEYLQLSEVSFSCEPYLIENAAKKEVINKIDCYNNIKSFMLFKSFKYSEFLKSGVYSYDKQEEDVWIATDELYNDMFSQTFAQKGGTFFEAQKDIYALLVKAIYIEFANSKKSAKNKIMELVDFVNNQLGSFTQRELEICYYYYKRDSRTKRFFKKIQKNSKELIKWIKGMAWDLLHVRCIEQENAMRPTNRERFAIHALLTYDYGLKEILEINPVEQFVFYKGIAVPKFKYNLLDEIPGVSEKLCSETNKKKRKMISKMRDIDALINVVESELLSVYNPINS